MKGGTTAMKSIRYRRGRENERDLAVYTRLMAEDNGSQLQQLRRNLAQALREEVTERQKQVLFYTITRGLPCGRLERRWGWTGVRCPAP